MMQNGKQVKVKYKTTSLKYDFQFYETVSKLMKLKDTILEKKQVSCILETILNTQIENDTLNMKGCIIWRIDRFAKMGGAMILTKQLM